MIDLNEFQDDSPQNSGRAELDKKWYEAYEHCQRTLGNARLRYLDEEETFDLDEFLENSEEKCDDD